MRVELDHGLGVMEADLPDDAFVLDPLVHLAEPSPVDAWEATTAALASPVGSPRLDELVGRGSRVVIAFPDRVKGGTHAAAHRKVAIPLLLDALEAAGVRRGDVEFVCAVGLHRMNTPDEMEQYLPEGLLEDFAGQVHNHDAEDPDGIVDLGHSALGDKVDFNRRCAEADLTVVLGHVQGNPYGGFSGGHKTFTTGLTSWQSIAGHHVPDTMNRSDFVPISPRSHFRSQLEAIGDRIERGIRGPLFLVDAVVGEGSNVLGVTAGSVSAVERATWPLAERRTNAVLDVDPFDVLAFGLPRDFHYGPGMGSNPILVGQAIASTITRCAGVFPRGGVAIVSAAADGWFNEEWFPAMPDVFELWSRHGSFETMRAERDAMCADPRFVDAYRFEHAYHPFHAFSMLAMAAVGRAYASRIFVVGATAHDQLRVMGLEPVDSVAEALALAERQVGRTPRVLGLPGFLRRVPPHLFSSRIPHPDSA